MVISPGGLYFKGYPPWNKQQENSPLQIGRTGPKRKLDRKLVFQPLFFRGELLVSGRVDVHIPLKKDTVLTVPHVSRVFAGLKQLSFRVQGVEVYRGWLGWEAVRFKKGTWKDFLLEKNESICFWLILLQYDLSKKKI